MTKASAWSKIIQGDFMKIMTFNIQHCVNHLSQKIDFDLFTHYLKGIDADIIGLNEVRGEGQAQDYQDQTKILADALGYYSYFGQSVMIKGVNPYGNAVLSRYPIKSAKVIPIPKVEKDGKILEPRSILHAVINSPMGEYNMFITHFGLTPKEHELAVQTITGNIKDEKCVLMGDFNVTPENPVLLPIRNKLYDTAEGFERSLLSFPSNAPEIKIDYVFTSKDIKVKKADIPPHVISDHRPYIIEV